MSVDASPIFVTGCTRSGKTLVAAILNKHPELHITFESQIYTGTFRKWSYDLRKHGADPRSSFKEKILGRIARLGISEEELTQCIEDGEGSWEAMYDRYMRLVISKNKPAATRWGDKTPVDAGTSSMILSHYPKAQFVYLYRDPRDTVSSMSLPDYTPCGNNHLINADVYDQYLREYSKEIYREGLNILRVRYETLVENPAEGVENICNFLGIDFCTPTFPARQAPRDAGARKAIY